MSLVFVVIRRIKAFQLMGVDHKVSEGTKNGNPVQGFKHTN